MSIRQQQATADEQRSARWPRLRCWLAIARRPEIVQRSIKIALIVGTILVFINYVDKLFPPRVSLIECGKMLLTYCVPYCVSTYASVSTVLAAGDKPQR